MRSARALLAIVATAWFVACGGGDAASGWSKPTWETGDTAAQQSTTGSTTPAATVPASQSGYTTGNPYDQTQGVTTTGQDPYASGYTTGTTTGTTGTGTTSATDTGTTTDTDTSTTTQPYVPSYTGFYEVKLTRVEGNGAAAVVCEFWDWRALTLFITPLTLLSWTPLAFISNALRAIPLVGTAVGVANRFGLALSDLGCDSKVYVEYDGYSADTGELQTDQPDFVFDDHLRSRDLIGKTLRAHVVDVEFYGTETTIGECTPTVLTAEILDRGTLTMSCIFTSVSAFTQLIADSSIDDALHLSAATTPEGIQTVQLTFAFH